MKLKRARPAGSVKLPPLPMAAKTTYMKTRMNAPATGLMTEYIANSQGSVQFDSICQPSHEAPLNERQWRAAVAFTDAVWSASRLAGRAIPCSEGRNGLRGRTRKRGQPR